MLGSDRASSARGLFGSRATYGRAKSQDPRECDGEGKSHGKAKERRIVRLCAFEVVEEDDHRDVPEEEKPVHQYAEEKRARRHVGKFRREVEEP